MANILNIKESTLVKNGPGKLKGVYINTHISGVMKILDGLTNGVVATTTLTSSGAMVPADYATSTLTSTGTAVADGDTVTVNTTVYTARTTLLYAGGVANEVLIGSTADGSAFLANLKKAINGTGVAGTDYGIGTVAHTTVVADTLTSTTLKVWARDLGTTPNAYPTTETSTQLSWADTTLGGGTGTSDPGVTAAGATFTIGTTTYTGVLRLAEAIGMTSVANQIRWVTSEAVFLDNIKSAINGSGVRGTDYSTATPVNSDVQATTNTNTTQVFDARMSGAQGNSIATTETMANYAFTGATMASGTMTAAKIIVDSMTFSEVSTTGERWMPFDVDFTSGLYVHIGGTSANLSIAYE